MYKSEDGYQTDFLQSDLEDEVYYNSVEDEYYEAEVESIADAQNEFEAEVENTVDAQDLEAEAAYTYDDYGVEQMDLETYAAQSQSSINLPGFEDDASYLLQPNQKTTQLPFDEEEAAVFFDKKDKREKKERAPKALKLRKNEKQIYGFESQSGESDFNNFGESLKYGAEPEKTEVKIAMPKTTPTSTVQVSTGVASGAAVGMASMAVAKNAVSSASQPKQASPQVAVQQQVPQQQAAQQMYVPTAAGYMPQQLNERFGQNVEQNTVPPGQPEVFNGYCHQVSSPYGIPYAGVTIKGIQGQNYPQPVIAPKSGIVQLAPIVIPIAMVPYTTQTQPVVQQQVRKQEEVPANKYATTVETEDVKPEKNISKVKARVKGIVMMLFSLIFLVPMLFAIAKPDLIPSINLAGLDIVNNFFKLIANGGIQAISYQAWLPVLFVAVAAMVAAITFIYALIATIIGKYGSKVGMIFTLVTFICAVGSVISYIAIALSLEVGVANVLDYVEFIIIAGFGLIFFIVGLCCMADKNARKKRQKFDDYDDDDII